jgi:hypothetical protein
MKMNGMPEMVNEAVVRGVALQVFLIASVTLVIQSPVPVLFLAADFFLRTAGGSRFSPLAFVSRKITVQFPVFRHRRITARPKRFAAGIGLTISLSAAVFFFFDLPVGMLVSIGLLALFSFLEAFLKFCAGCKIFSLLIRLGIASEDLCTDCVYPGGDGI